MEELKRAIIVAAGEGKRLRPVSLETPKPLVRVNGTRLIDTEINALKQNGIHEIIIVAGYKKEQFYEAYKDDPEITVVENVNYQRGNNITSLYAARDYLPGSFVLEGDLMISEPAIFSRSVEKSGYCANWLDYAPEWAIRVRKGRIISCDIGGGPEAYRLWGISMWTQKDGELLAELVRQQIEDIKDWDVYWDQLALEVYADRFDLGVREIKAGDIVEIDSFDELVEMDPGYLRYKKEDVR